MEILPGEESMMIPNALLEMRIVRLSTGMEQLGTRVEELLTIGCAKTLGQLNGAMEATLKWSAVKICVA